MSDKHKAESKAKFPFESDIKARFKKWTGIMDADIEEALRELTGDTYFEIRKLVSQLLTEVERKIESGQYPGYIDGVPLTEEQKKNLMGTKEDLKEFLRTTVEESWRSILTKQKIGVDKLGLALKTYLSNSVDNEED